MNWIILLFLFFAFLGVVLSLLFFLKHKGNRFSNTVLGVYTLLFAFELLNNCLRWSGDIQKIPFVHLNLAHFPLWTAYGALVFIYVRNIIDQTRFKRYDMLFLLPPMITIGMLWPFYRLSTQDKLMAVEEGKIFEIAIFPSYTIWIVIAIMFFYGFLTYLTFWQKKRIGFRENVWLKWFVGSYLGFVFAFALYIFLVRFQLMDPSYDYLVDLAITAFIAMLAFFGFVQPDVFEGKSIHEVLPFIKYRKTGLSPALSLEMKEKLLQTMQSGKPYLNHELRLDDVAKTLHLSRNQTSQIINEHFNLSFFDFVNQYRIKEAKNLLLQNTERNRTIDHIAYDVGFNNRASFYKAFRKFTNNTPTNYIKHMEAS